MKNDRLGANVLSMKVIPNVDPALAKELSLKPEHRSLGIVTSDCDDVTYVALDEATKAADVTVVYGKSMYAGAANASTKLAGEVIGIIAGPSPAEVNSGLSVITQVIEEEASFYSANEDDSIVYFAHVVSRNGPPSETNFGGALLTGSQSACKAACSAFEQVIQNIADNPLSY
ncbi:ethanolamine utilization microcompartment protein EutL [Enterococcus faecalis]|uniref:ethanolamine utilization microcompartment protein EutL n=1 Tax=Enterococcus faecalis TaxID=1351 RepID=UPI000F8081BB|nr:ethanolamine utilization microcompartment protein EutL [Enterococcus faecalis]RTK55514.1 ethanolamine utilization microcompartment protein EutL [Enterococcus faecalis]